MEQKLNWGRHGGYDRALARETEFVAFHREADGPGPGYFDISNFASCDDIVDIKLDQMPSAGGGFIDFDED